MEDRRDAVQQARQHFRDARKQAFVNAVLGVLSGKPTDLLSFQEVQQKLGLRYCTMGRLATVPIEKIVGSEGRYHDFDRDFLPLHVDTEKRWESLDVAFNRMESLPPVELYRVGDVFFVRDGNHRVSVARRNGVKYLDAWVIECPSRVSLDSGIDVRQLLVEEEHLQFLDRTHLDQVLGVDIKLTATGAYDALQRHIEGHRYFLNKEQHADVPFEEAARSWHTNVYLPTVQVIRDEGVLERFPERTEGDLYIWVLEHHYYLREKYGDKVTLGDAARSFASHYGRGRYGRMREWWMKRTASVVGGVMSWFRR